MARDAALLHKYGFRFHSRPEYGEPIWWRARPWKESEALAYCVAEEEAIARKRADEYFARRKRKLA